MYRQVAILLLIPALISWCGCDCESKANKPSMSATISDHIVETLPTMMTWDMVMKRFGPMLTDGLWLVYRGEEGVIYTFLFEPVPDVPTPSSTPVSASEMVIGDLRVTAVLKQVEGQDGGVYLYPAQVRGKKVKLR
jgi:hypothetical protein